MKKNGGGGGGGGLSMRDFDDMNTSSKNDDISHLIKSLKSEVDYMKLLFTSDKMIEVNRATEAIQNIK